MLCVISVIFLFMKYTDPYRNRILFEIVDKHANILRVKRFNISTDVRTGVSELKATNSVPRTNNREQINITKTMKENVPQNNKTLADPLQPSANRRIYEMHLWNKQGKHNRYFKLNSTLSLTHTKACLRDSVLPPSHVSRVLKKYCFVQNCSQWKIDELFMALGLPVIKIEKSYNSNGETMSVGHLISNNANSTRNQLSRTSNISHPWTSDTLHKSVPQPNAIMSNICSYELPAIATAAGAEQDDGNNYKWWRVNHHSIDMFMLKAYYDKRFAENIIRIIAVAASAIKQHSVKCVMWNSKHRLNNAGNDVSDREAATFCRVRLADRHIVNAETIIPDLGTYDQYIFSCNADNGFQPKYVTLIIDDAATSSSALRIHHQPAADGENSIKDVVICIPPLFGYPDISWLTGWLEIHRRLGVSKVYAYGMYLSEDAERLLRMYENEGFVNYVAMEPCLESEPEASVLLAQSSALNDCMYANMFRYRFICTSDIDEIIVPRHHDNYSQMIEYFRALNNHWQRNDSASAASDEAAASYIVRNAYFFVETKNAGATLHSDKTQAQLTNRLHAISSAGYSSKGFINPMTCLGLQNHLCWHHVINYNASRTLRHVSPEVALLHHYKTCHFDNYLNQQGVCELMMRYYSCDNHLLKLTRTIANRIRSKIAEYISLHANESN